VLICLIKSAGTGKSGLNIFSVVFSIRAALLSNFIGPMGPVDHLLVINYTLTNHPPIFKYDKKTTCPTLRTGEKVVDRALRAHTIIIIIIIIIIQGKYEEREDTASFHRLVLKMAGVHSIFS